MYDPTASLDALGRLSILDTSPEDAFDRMTDLAARLFAVPLSLVSFLDRERQWFKSHHGTEVCETPLSVSFCVHAARADDILVVPDATLDSRFADNPLVTGDFHVRFYAGAPLRTPDGLVLGTLCILDTKPRIFGPAARQTLTDLAALVERELELRRAGLELREAAEIVEASRQKYRSIFDNAIEGIFQTTPAGRFLSANPAAARILGYDDPEDLTASINSLAHDLYANPGDRDEFVRVLARCGSVSDFEARFLRKNGTTVWVSLCARIAYDESGAAAFYEGTAQDISERKMLETERAAQLADALERADRDPLTGLWNHRAFHRALQDEAERARRLNAPLGIVLLGLDDFKFFNSAYGHAAGDDVLRQVADVLRGCCRPCDTLSRFGGDEFGVLLPGADAAETAAMKARLCESVRSLACRPSGSQQDVPLCLSPGASFFPDDGPDAVAVAAARLRRAKEGSSDEQAELLRARLTQRREGFSMLDALVAAVDNKDRYTRRHSEDVMHYAVAIARQLGLDDKTQHTVEVAALLHDVGKIGVPDGILRKPGALTDAEFEAIRQHPMMGAIIVGAVPGFEETLDAVRHHHERWDGEGYPFGLRGTEIPLLGRIMAVADAYSAMTTDRPYRKGMNPERALSILQDGAGVQWDAECVAAFAAQQCRRAA